MKFLVLFVFFSFVLPLYAEDLQKEDPENPVCVIKTSEGDIFVEMFSKEAPLTVANFFMLANAEKEFVDAITGESVKRHYYDGLIFHRVIKDFMIQGGCPLGTGSGGPGYVIPDEISASSLGLDKEKAVDENKKANPFLMVRSQEDFNRIILSPCVKKLKITSEEEYKKRMPEIEAEMTKMTIRDCYESMGYQYQDKLTSHDLKRGVLAMANRGPNSNGSQFFINLIDTPWLTGKHTVFGKVIKGMDIVDKIGNVSVDEKSKPRKDVKVISIRLWKEKE